MTLNQNRLIITVMTRAINLQYTEMPDLIFIDKISGINTHTPAFGQRGCVEIYEDALDKKLFVVQRLDKGTSGAMMFATTPEMAASLTQLLENQEVEKKYLFLTHQKSAKTEFDYKSFIHKEKNAFVSETDKEPNAHTRFKFLGSRGEYYLWEAQPLTGKPHQIRLHAEANGIPVLGDKDHNGKPFFRLCLHSLSSRFKVNGKDYFFQTALPAWASEGISHDEETLALYEALQRRERLFGRKDSNEQCLRLSHRDIDTYRIDQYGDHIWVYWYKESDPTDADIMRFEEIAEKLDKKLYVRKMLNRGDNPNAQIMWTARNPETRWQAKENQVSFELRSDSGLSPGLFLDQRENRMWVASQAEGRSVLNLFSYTSGFSVVSALAGARDVCTVDVSANFIEWSKRNFEINGLDPEDEKYEFWVQDCLLFLKGAYRRKRKYGLIVCDPPSFGRSKNGTFSISKNFDELVLNCLYCLEKNGLLLFCTNYEKWTTGDLHLRLNKLKKDFSFKVLDAPLQGLDFELPDQDPLMKSIIIRKN
ncbi:methyltransferase [Bdellovibrio bacteriovorus W]|nr:methyltransferase [Bdellovibrio bacteriovorus W]